MTNYRAPSPTDFTVEVDGIGHFSFARRKMRDELDIGVEISKITQGVDTPTVWLENVAGWIATLRVLTVVAPNGWDIDEMDPLDDTTYRKIHLVFSALRVKEQSFRKGPATPNQGSGEGPGGQT